MKKYLVASGIVGIIILSVVGFSNIDKNSLDDQQAAVSKAGVVSSLEKESTVKTTSSAEVESQAQQAGVIDTTNTIRKPIAEISESSDTADEAVIDTPVINTNPEVTLMKNPTLAKGCNERSPQSITVLAPNGGEVYSIGIPVTSANYMDITWTSCNIPSNQSVLIELTSGFNVGIFADQATHFSFTSMNTGSKRVLLRPDTFSFNIGNPNFTTMPNITTITPGTYFKIRITVLPLGNNNIFNLMLNGTNISDSSDNFFSIFDGCTARIENVLPASATNSLINAQEPAPTVMKLKVTAQNCSVKIKRFDYTQLNVPYSQTVMPFTNEIVQTRDPRTRTGLLYDFRIIEQIDNTDSTNLSHPSHPYRIAHWYNNFSGESNAGQIFEQGINALAWVGVNIASPFSNLNWVLDLPPAPWNYSPSGGSESNPQEFYDKGWVQFKDNVIIDAGTSRTFNIKSKPTTTVLKWFHDDPCSVSVFGLSNDDNSDDYSYCGVYADQNRPYGRRENQNIQLVLSDFQIEDMSGHEATTYPSGQMAPVTSQLINIY